jgi:GTP-binding protein Era
MLRRSLTLWTTQLKQSSQRRAWETAVTNAVGRSHDTNRDKALEAYQRVYQQKNFVPVEEAFPLTDPRRWSSRGTGIMEGDQKPPQPMPEQGAATEKRFVAKVAIVGPPNAGKSTLLNALSGAHVSAASKREGTTKGWIKGISTVNNTQLIMLDTPGVFHVQKPQDRKRFLGHTFAAWDALLTAEVCLLTLPVGLGYVRKEEKAVIKEVLFKAGSRKIPCLLALTKMDTIHIQSKATHRHLYQELRADIDRQWGKDFAGVFEVSAKTYKGVLELKDFLCRYGKEGAWKYFPQQRTDMILPERCAEILSELIFKHLPAGIPHMTTHRVIGWTESDVELQIDIEVFHEKPAFMSVFYGKQFLIRKELSRELQGFIQKKLRITFHSFVAPGGVRKQ